MNFRHLLHVVATIYVRVVLINPGLIQAPIVTFCIVEDTRWKYYPVGGSPYTSDIWVIKPPKYLGRSGLATIVPLIM